VITKAEAERLKGAERSVVCEKPVAGEVQPRGAVTIVFWGSRVTGESYMVIRSRKRRLSAKVIQASSRFVLTVF